MNGLAMLYNVTEEEKKPFGEHWCGPLAMHRGIEVLVARYDSPEEQDGQPVDVYCTAYPARGYRIKVRAISYNGGEHADAWTLSTGTGCGEFVAKLAEEISIGMLGLEAS